MNSTSSGVERPVSAPPLSVSISVPTRNRPKHAEECARAILATDGFVDLIMVDQSDDRETETRLSAITDPRLRYVRTDTRGVTRARNIGLEASNSDILAFTDDDCRIRPDWVARIIDVFTADPQVAVVCGRVVVPPEIQHLGYAEGFEPRVREWQGRYPPLGSDWGITANFSIRRSALATIGLFDPFLGAGAPLRSGGEPDFLFRALRAGFKVVNAEEVVLEHYGIRKPGAEFKKLIMGYGAGTAAAMFKYVRIGDPAGTMVYFRFLASSIGMVAGNVLRGKRPTGANYLRAFINGTFDSFRFGVDRKAKLYVER